MGIKIKLSSQQSSDLKFIIQFSDELFDKIIFRLKNIKPMPIHPSGIENVLQDILLNRKNGVEIVMRQLLSLYTLRRQRGLSAKNVLDGLYNSLSTDVEGWDEKELNRWKEIDKKLIELLSLNSIMTVVKALDLSYDYTNLLQNIKILTDVRPIFNEEASKIQGSIISFTLRIYYDSIDGSKSLNIAIDEDDVKKIQSICERALKKSNTAKKFMIDNDIERTFICGEE